MAANASVSHPVPVVRLVVPNADGEVLIVQRAGPPAAGRWCLPGGKVAYNETVRDAVRRELREETALECESARFLFYQDSLPPEPGTMHCINLYFECSVSGDVRMNPESSDWAWIGPDDLGKYDVVFRNDEGLRRYW